MSNALIWLGLTIAFGFLTTLIYRNYASIGRARRGKWGNKLGRAMVNMERACIFCDHINFYEFAKYAVREAMGLPQGKTGLELTLADMEHAINARGLPKEIASVVREIYTISEGISEDSETIDIDLKSKLDTYYGAIRALNTMRKHDSSWSA
jgi:hypothetical protein